MSKVVVSLPQGMVKNTVIGGLVALASYAALQFLWALLIHQGLLGIEAIYPLACLSAAAAAFLGCGYNVLRGKAGAMLSVGSVVVVFLTLTLAAALMAADTDAIRSGLAGVGLSMAAGGLAAGVLGGTLARSRQGRSKSRRRRHGRGKR